ncbi:hypothetical protein E4U42_003781 [Claviceps africana]|uniref:Uncharacterized protein n=1 Tax=Claviceps africana TaxID=83212 RepID=A0A8K0NGL3_9HYPO|nr:hypothetical protein E4U42_003781 [Claviceps africana]
MPADDSCARRWRRPAQHVPLVPHLVVVPVLLAVATAVSLFVHSDVNAALLWSQCHARALLPALSRVRVLGTPACFLVSFLHAALDSLRSRAVLGVVLAFVGSLLTVSTVEAARPMHAGNPVVARPTLPWLVFNLVGGALVWQLVIVPAFILAAKAWPAPPGRAGRELAATEVVAIPVAVALGFYLPSALMLAGPSPVSIGVWLFFPVYVSLVRRLVRHLLGLTRWFRSAPPCHVESRVRTALAVYALPLLASVLAHGLVAASFLAGADDRKELTRSAVRFIEIDFQYIGLTLLYWVFVEVGWRVPLAMVASSVLLGPGAGTVLGWLYRERLITSDRHVLLRESAVEDGPVGEESERDLVDEQTPLVR